MPKLQNVSKGDSNPGSLDCKSGIVPKMHRAPVHVQAFPWSFTPITDLLMTSIQYGINVVGHRII